MEDGTGSKLQMAAREALAEWLRKKEGERVVFSLRFNGPIALAPNAWGNGPFQVDGYVLGVEGTEAVRVRGEGAQKGIGSVGTEHFVPLEDVLVATTVGEVMGAKRQIMPG